MNSKKITQLKEIKETNDSHLHFDIVVQLKKLYKADSGLHIFTVSDGLDTMQFVAFTKESGKYEGFLPGNYVFFTVKQKNYEGKIQGDVQFAKITEASDELKAQFAKQAQQANEPKSTTLSFAFPAFEKLKPFFVAAATQIRKAITERRPILITHHADCDGFAAGILLERAITQQIEQHNADARYLQNYIQRNPSKTPYYNLSDVTRDIAWWQLNAQRAGTGAPLILIVDNGSTEQDVIAMKKAKLFGADVLVIDHHDPGKKDEQGKTVVCHETLVHVNPHLVAVDKNMSASMLCYQIAAYVNELEKPSLLLAAAGGVADKCSGEAIETFVSATQKEKTFFEELARCIDYEIYHTKYNHHTGALYDLFDGEKQTALMELYRPILEKERNAVHKSVVAYAQKENIGPYHVAFLDGEATTLWGDYYSIGKLAAILHDAHAEQKNHITIVYSNNIVVFRVQQHSEHHFDVNELLAGLTQEIDFARIDGGGHDVAGSIRFVAAAQKDVLAYIKAYIAKK